MNCEFKKPIMEGKSFFYENVENIIKNKEDLCYSTNTGIDKAVQMLSCMFNNSNTIHIFANNEKSNVSDNREYELAVRNFLYRGGKVFLVVKNKINVEKAFRIYRLLYTYALEVPDCVKIGVADEVFKNQVLKMYNDKLNNFCVADKDFVRIEYDTKKYLADGYRSPDLGNKLAILIEECVRRTNYISWNNHSVGAYSY